MTTVEVGQLWRWNNAPTTTFTIKYVGLESAFGVAIDGGCTWEMAVAQGALRSTWTLVYPEIEILEGGAE